MPSESLFDAAQAEIAYTMRDDAMLRFRGTPQWALCRHVMRLLPLTFHNVSAAAAAAAAAEEEKATPTHGAMVATLLPSTVNEMTELEQTAGGDRDRDRDHTIARDDIERTQYSKAIVFGAPLPAVRSVNSPVPVAARARSTAELRSGHEHEHAERKLAVHVSISAAEANGPAAAFSPSHRDSQQLPPQPEQPSPTSPAEARDPLLPLPLPLPVPEGPRSPQSRELNVPRREFGRANSMEPGTLKPRALLPAIAAIQREAREGKKEVLRPHSASGRGVFIPQSKGPSDKSRASISRTGTPSKTGRLRLEPLPIQPPVAVPEPQTQLTDASAVDSEATTPELRLDVNDG